MTRELVVAWFSTLSYQVPAETLHYLFFIRKSGVQCETSSKYFIVPAFYWIPTSHIICTAQRRSTARSINTTTHHKTSYSSDTCSSVQHYVEEDKHYSNEKTKEQRTFKHQVQDNSKKEEEKMQSPFCCQIVPVFDGRRPTR